MNFLLPFCAFTSAVATRAMDPLVSSLATEFGISIAAAALAVTMFALPYSIGQPVLGPAGDHYGKIRILKICLWVQTASLILVAVAPTFELLLVGRFIGGIAGGGLMPIALAIVADKVAPSQRQAAIARNVTGSLSGLILAASGAGLMAVWLNWRAIFGVATAISLIAAILVTLQLKETVVATRHLRLSDAFDSYRQIITKRRAWICFIAVMFEGIALFGMFPFIAPVLQSRGMGGPAEAGFMITACGVGSLIFTFLVRRLLRVMSRYGLMIAGGALAMMGLLALAFAAPLPWLAFFFALSGFGYMMVHNSIHAEVSELTDTARTSAFALHSCFFFTGQALGPLLFGAGMGMIGASGILIVYGAILLMIGPIISVLLRRARATGSGALAF
ncbi:MFS transporter [Methylocella sp. CPCC 101449]|uniref:MFS transporter n=1 Tax=Methylocella sp. CPCC 101449 TaxID=2987531 RepID=UPI002891D0C0|nr:MFS transporter [Methylocella sp. CPCC 101449]MDT2020343.1 MFS transporter [Methylocella sp. CPCC 101449]